MSGEILEGAGIAPLHPYAQYDKDHPQKEELRLMWSIEAINRAELLGYESYHGNIIVPYKDVNLMVMLECHKVEFDRELMAAWVKGYSAAKRAYWVGTALNA